MESHGVVVQTGSAAATPVAAAAIGQSILDKDPHADLILKAQIHAGGRGKGHFVNSGLKGGVKILSTVEEVSLRRYI